MFSVEHIQLAKHNPKRSVSLVTDLQQVRACCGRMHDMLLTVTRYVDDVLVSFQQWRYYAGDIDLCSVIFVHIYNTKQQTLTFSVRVVD